MTRAAPFVVVAAALCLSCLSSCGGGDEGSAPPATAEPDPNACTSNPAPVFTHHFFDTSKFKSITPPGGVHDAGTIFQRTYAWVRDDLRTTGETIPLYAPANVSLISMAHYENPATPGSPPEFVLVFRASCEVSFGFAHVKDVSDRIRAVAPPVGGSSAPTPIAPIALSAGEVFGSMKGGDRALALDIFAQNTSVTNVFANPERRAGGNGESGPHGVCPYGFFPPDMYRFYDEIFGTIRGPVAGMGCRSGMQDVAGTIQGGWFSDRDYTRNGDESFIDDGDYGHLLAIAPDGADTVRIAKLRGGTINVESSSPSFRLPSEVTDRHCYQKSQNGVDEGWVFFEVGESNTLRVVYSPTGTCPATFPAEQARTYHR